ncbi:hypothetical protein U3A55_03455 [Salarchaeum sp. III]|uniref:hypothetical protein n=1 Tax=Salarchaeum sp. III TaxID=3107927 RepID=UPI002ED7F76C
MPDCDVRYEVQDRTGNGAHASVDDVCELLLSRAAAPRDDYEDGYVDAAMATIVDQYGKDTVRDIVRLILAEGLTHRTAATDLDMRPVEGVWIGTTAGWYLRELNAQSET